MPLVSHGPHLPHLTRLVSVADSVFSFFSCNVGAHWTVSRYRTTGLLEPGKVELRLTAIQKGSENKSPYPNDSRNSSVGQYSLLYQRTLRHTTPSSHMILRLL